jgi:hypothetical protein
LELARRMILRQQKSKSTRGVKAEILGPSVADFKVNGKKSVEAGKIYL